MKAGPCIAAGVMAAFIWASGSAAAEDCADTLRTEALGVSLRPVTTGGELQAALTDMDALATRCPEDPWINALGAQMDLRVYSALLANNNNQMTQQAFDFLHRAFLRSSLYGNTPAEERREVVGLQTPHGRGGLSHSAATSVRQEIMGVFLAMARLGQMHPYLESETPLTCNAWMRVDSQAIGYPLQSQGDLVLLPFVDAAAEACREAPETWMRTPLAVAAQAYTRLVQKGVITEASAIRDSLLKARANRDAYLATEGFDAFYSKLEAGQLDAELRKHGVDPMAGRIARGLWFAPEHLGSEAMQFSLAWGLGETWGPLAARMQTEGLPHATADAEYTRFVYEVLAEGRAAGKEEETKAALRKALTDVQTYRVRALAMENYDAPRAVTYTTLMKGLEAAPAPAGGN